MDRENVVPLPLLEGGSIEDTLTGFATQIDRDSHLGRRVERTVTVVVAELRGLHDVQAVVGPEQAQTILQRALDRMLQAMESFRPEDVSVEGEWIRPAIVATFTGDHHPLRAVVAGEAMRDAAGSLVHPSMSERFQAGVGVNTGTIVETHLAKSGIAFSACGTTRTFAARLQEFAGPGQVLISDAIRHAIPVADAVAVGALRTSPDGETEEAYLLRSLVPPDVL